MILKNNFYFIRHAPIDRTKQIYIGHKNVSIMPCSIVPKIQFLENAIFISSPLKRCVQSFSLLNIYKPKLEKAFMEQGFGIWEGRTYNAVWKETKHLTEWNTPHLIKPENSHKFIGENFVELVQRVAKALIHINESYNNQNIYIMTHLGVLRSIQVIFNKFSFEDSLYYKADYWSIIQFNKNAGTLCKAPARS